MARTCLQVYKNPTIHVWMYASMQVCKYASMKVCKYESVQECKHAKNLLNRSFWIKYANRKIYMYTNMQGFGPNFSLTKRRTKRNPRVWPYSVQFVLIFTKQVHNISTKFIYLNIYKFIVYNQMVFCKIFSKYSNNISDILSIYI